MHAGKIHKGWNKIRSFLFFGRGAAAAAAAHNISTEAERGITLSFLVTALLLLFTHREGYAAKT